VPTLLALLFGVGTLAVAGSPDYQPRSYWRFEDSKKPLADSKQHYDLQPSASAEGMFSVETTGGAVGSYLRFNGSSTSSGTFAATAGQWKCNVAPGCAGVTVEFLVRIGHNFNLHGKTAILRSHGQGSGFNFESNIGRHSYGLHAGNDPAFPIQDIPGMDVITRLNGTGTRSPFYLYDGQWHHFAFRRRSEDPNRQHACAEAQIWVDGESQTSFRSESTSGKVGNFTSGETITFLSDSFAGDIDEVAVWEVPLPESLIHAHAVGALKDKQPYRLDDPGGVVPPAPNRTGEFDLKEFAPGTQLPTPAGLSTQGVTVSCLDQIRSFPVPRYPASPAYRRLQPLSNCMDSNYMAGENQENITKEEMINGSLAIQAELAGTWGYALIWGDIEQLGIERHAEVCAVELGA
jgi:hypothetical protein